MSADEGEPDAGDRRSLSISNASLNNNNLNKSLFSERSASPQNSYKRSPIIESKPVLLTSSANTTPNKHKKYIFPSHDKMNENEYGKSYTLPLLDEDALNINTTSIKNTPKEPLENRVIHRSLLNNDDLLNRKVSKNDDKSLSNTHEQSVVASSVVSRRFSADDKNRSSPIQTYVVLHQKSHNYQFFNDNTRSSAFWSRSDVFNDEKSKESKHDKHEMNKDEPEIRKIERLNFDRMENEIYHKEWKRGFGKRGLYKWIICLLIGILTGLCMYVITVAIQFILNILILENTRKYVAEAWWKGTVFYLACNICCALIAAASVVFIERAAAGSGIPEVKAYLNGSWIPHLFNIRTLFVKLFGVTFAVSGSFIIGKEGPMVHAGAIIANGMSRGRSRTLGFDCHIGYTFRNDKDARDFISCGAAAGVSAAFGAPVGGMLFALEEVSSFWKGSLTWRSFFCAAIAAFVLDTLLSCFDNNKIGTCGVFTRIGLITFNSHNENQKSLSEYHSGQLIAFLLIGVIGGLIGALFNWINVQLCYFRKRIFYVRRNKLYPILDVLFAAFMTTMIVMVIPQWMPITMCRDKDIVTCSDSYDADSCHNIKSENQFGCDSNEYNTLSALLLGEREQIIKYLFHYDSRQFFNATQVIICCVAYFIMAVYTYGLSIPSGLFIPLILIGSTFGWVFGYQWEYYVMGDDSSKNLNTYALMGASALLGGSTRMTISLTAIIMEITNDIYYLLPIMLVVMVSKWVGDRFNAAIYESHVALSNIPYLENSLPRWVPSYLCAKDVATRNVQCLPIICPLRILNRYLRDKDKIHNAFPIIDCEPNKKAITENYNKSDGKFVGIMLRWHIMILLSKRNFAILESLPDLELLTLNDLTDSEYKNKYISSYQKDFGISLYELNHCYVDFSPYMHLSPFTVQTYTPLYRVYTLFRGLGLRHLIVLDAHNKYIDGIITATNLSESSLEHCVNKLNIKIANNEITNNDYITHRLQQMNQSKTIRKYHLSKRFLSIDTNINYQQSIDTNIKYQQSIDTNIKYQQSVPIAIVTEHEHDNDDLNQSLLTNKEKSKSMSNLSIAENERDMKHTINTSIDYGVDEENNNINNNIEQKMNNDDNDDDDDDDDDQQSVIIHDDDDDDDGNDEQEEDEYNVSNNDNDNDNDNNDT